jgi:hypothetical protein
MIVEVDELGIFSVLGYWIEFCHYKGTQEVIIFAFKLAGGVIFHVSRGFIRANFYIRQFLFLFFDAGGTGGPAGHVEA